MKSVIALNIILCACSQAAVSSNDIAIIGHYTTGSGSADPRTGDAFAWLVLQDIAAGETLYFSDASYRSATNSFIQENLVRFVAPSLIPAGIVMTFESGNLPQGYTTLGDTAYSTSTSQGLEPTTSGDQLVIFQDSDVSNSAGFTALWAVNNASTQWGSSSTSQTESDLYPGLTNGVNALALGAGSGPSDEFDNVRYMGPTSGTVDEIRTNIRNLSNWTRTDDPQVDYLGWVSNGASSFTIVPEPSASGLLGLGAFLIAFRRKRG